MTATGPATPAHRVAALDGVRGLAILAVVIHNASWIGDGSSAFALKLFIAVTATGWAGVSLFFVLSGVLITGILLDSRERPHYFRSFYVRRTLRIFPLYYAFLALVFWVGPLVVHDAAWVASVRADQAWYWTYLSNWAPHSIHGLPHVWSLAVEEQFYLLWPLAVWLLGPRRLLGLCIAMIATGPLIRFGLRWNGLGADTAYVYTVARWDALAVGAALAILLRQAPGREWLARYAQRIGWAALAATLAVCVPNRGFHQDDYIVEVLGQSLAAILFGAVVWAAIVPEGRVASRIGAALSAPWLRFLGKYSYAIYIFHATLHHVAQTYLRSAVNTGGTAERLARLVVYDAGILAVSVLLALVSWNVLEKHALRLKDRLAPA